MLSKYTSPVTLPTPDHKFANDTGHVIQMTWDQSLRGGQLTVGAIIS